MMSIEVYLAWQKSLGSSFGLGPNTTPGLAAGRVRLLRVSEDSRQWRDAVPHVSLAVGRRAQGCIRRADCIATTSMYLYMYTSMTRRQYHYSLSQQMT